MKSFIMAKKLSIQCFEKRPNGKYLTIFILYTSALRFQIFFKLSSDFRLPSNYLEQSNLLLLKKDFGIRVLERILNLKTRFSVFFVTDPLHLEVAHKLSIYQSELISFMGGILPSDSLLYIFSKLNGFQGEFFTMIQQDKLQK